MDGKTRARQIDDAEIPEVINLITRGFGTQFPRPFCEHIFACLSRRSVPAGCPRYGYVLESGGKLVGVILSIFSSIRENGEATIRCNGLLLYVDPPFRLYTPLLISRLFKRDNVTVLNLNAAPFTYEMVETQKYIRYSTGMVVAIPVLSRAPKGIRPRIINALDRPDVPYDPQERDLLLEHASYGCLSLWCIADGKAYPFVFRLRTVRCLPCAQLVYCRDVDSFVRFARPLGWYLARRGRPLALVDANGPVRGLVGKYCLGSPRYFFGPHRPRIGDLAYTEISMFGI
jgi:hypothetical protein